MWKRGIKEKDEEAEEVVMEALMDLVMKDEEWSVKVIHVRSSDVPNFTVEFNAKVWEDVTTNNVKDNNDDVNKNGNFNN